MSNRGFSEDVPALLYIVPFLLSAVYGLYLWARAGISAVLPTDVYLTVTRDPYVFLLGSFAVIFGVVLDTSRTDGDRQAKMRTTADTLQSIAIASLVLALLGAWYSNGFQHLTSTFTDFIVGRYSVVFPTLMVLLSFLLTINVRGESLRNPKFLGVVALLAVPAVVYEVGKRATAVGVALGLVLLVIGVWVFMRSERTQGQTTQK